MTTVDYLIVGSGLTGGTIARRLVDAGREVLLLERREHVGGNVYDVRHESGIRVHVYGPHYFRCSSARIWEFVNRFSEFRSYDPELKVRLDDVYEDWPISRRLLVGWTPPRNRRKPRDFEEACLRKIPVRVYERMIEGYTRRQWGVDPRFLRPELAGRIRVNGSDHPSLMSHCAHRALPADGYAAWVNRLIEGIPCLRGIDYLRRRDEFCARKLLISTGSIDEFFGFDEGHLAYRSQQRTHEYFRDRRYFQPCVQVNFPDGDATGPLRTIEWKYMLPPAERDRIPCTLVTHERPYSPVDPDAFEYPYPDGPNQVLYRRYRARAAADPRVLICGRLGDYRYYDMDHAIGRALLLADRIVGKTAAPVCPPT